MKGEGYLVTRGSLIYYFRLRTPVGGCQGSIWGDGSTIYYSGPAGITSNDQHDDRGKLTLYKGTTDAKGIYYCKTDMCM